MGILPTSKEDDGSDRYTVPAIHDPSTVASIADSLLIVEYLEKTYPDTPEVFSNNTLALQVASVDALMGQATHLWNFIIPPSCLKLNHHSEEHYRCKGEKCYGKMVEEITPKREAAVAEWAKVKDGFGNLDGVMGRYCCRQSSHLGEDCLGGG
jgi:glutathione S-transferase